MTLPCDVFLGPHGRFFDLEGKFARVQGGAKDNPFIDPVGCRQYVERGEAADEIVISVRYNGATPWTLHAPTEHGTREEWKRVAECFRPVYARAIERWPTN